VIYSPRYNPLEDGYNIQVLCPSGKQQLYVHDVKRVCVGETQRQKAQTTLHQFKTIVGRKELKLII